MRSLTVAIMVGVVSAIVACSSTARPTTIIDPPRVTRTPVPASDDEAIRQLINAEGEAVVQQDIDRLAGIWDSEGIVIDATPTGGKSWRGWEAIRDRYMNIVFPSNLTVVEHPNIQITITGNGALATSDTRIGTTDLKQNDRWSFQKINGEWKITSLTFGLALK